MTISAVQAEVVQASYNPTHRLLWLRGYVLSHFAVTGVTVTVNGVELGKANIGKRHVARPNQTENLFGGWTFEGVSPQPIRTGDVLEVLCEVEGGQSVLLTHQFPFKRQPLPARAPQNPVVKAVRSRVGKLWRRLKGAANPPLTLGLERRNVVLLSLHNFDFVERREKQVCIDRLNQALNRFGWDLVVLNHSDSPMTQVDSVRVVPFRALNPPQSFRDRSLVHHEDARSVIRDATGLLAGFHGSQGKNDPWARTEAQVVDEFIKYEYAIDQIKPSCCILWHQWNSFSHSNRFICERNGIPTVFAHEGFLPDTLGVDIVGEMAESYPVRAGDRFNALPLSDADLAQADAYLDHLRRNKVDRKAQSAPGSVTALVQELRKKNRPILFYAGSNDWQSGVLPAWWPNARKHSPYFVNSFDALDHLYELCRKNDWYLLYKGHPNIAHKQVGREDRILTVREGNIIECVCAADVTLTLVSTVSYVAMTNDRPVVLMGGNSMLGSGALYEYQGLDNLPGAIEAALERRDWPAKVQAYRDHVARLLRYYLFPYTDAAVERGAQTFDDMARFLLKKVIARP